MEVRVSCMPVDQPVPTRCFDAGGTAQGVAPGSELRLALLDAIDNKSDEDTEIEVVLKGVNKEGATEEIGRSVYALAPLIRTKKDPKPETLKVMDDSGRAVAQLKFALSGSAALHQLKAPTTPEVSEAPSASGSTKKRLAFFSRSKREELDEASIRKTVDIDVSSVTLSTAELKGKFTN
eukprot:557157-Pleurochrysis_carterae.AAC.3